MNPINPYPELLSKAEARYNQLAQAIRTADAMLRSDEGVSLLDYMETGTEAEKLIRSILPEWR